MYKRITTTLLWTVTFFVLLGGFNYLTGENEWLKETLDWVIPSALGFFIGYGQADKD